MSPAELKFKGAVILLIRQNTYPSPMTINVLLERKHRDMHTLNGRECRWRNEVLDPWMALNTGHPITQQRAERRNPPYEEI